MPETTEFKKLLLASFISQTGSHFLTLALSAFVLVSTGSLIQASLVFVLSFFPSILVGARLGHWVDSRISKWLIARNELVSILATLLCGMCIQFHLSIVFLCIVLSFRSVLMFIGRAAATKWLKLITPPAFQTNGIKLFYLAFFLSTAVSGCLAALVLNHASIGMIALIDALTYLFGIAMYMSLKPAAVESSAVYAVSSTTEPVPTLRETLTTIFSMPAVWTSFLIVCFSQALFQGAYSALVSYLPIKAFQIGVGGVGAFQVAASIGITGGFLINWLTPKVLVEKESVFPVRAIIVSMFAVISTMMCVSVSDVSASLAFFLCLNLAYECVWLHHSSVFFRASPKHNAARYQFTLSSCAAFLMSVSTLGYSAAVQYLGTVTGTAMVLGIGLLLITATVIFSKRSVHLPIYREESL